MTPTFCSQAGVSLQQRFVLVKFCALHSSQVSSPSVTWPRPVAPVPGDVWPQLQPLQLGPVHMFCLSALVQSSTVHRLLLQLPGIDSSGVSFVLPWQRCFLFIYLNKVVFSSSSSMCLSASLGPNFSDPRGRVADSKDARDFGKFQWQSHQIVVENCTCTRKNTRYFELILRLFSMTLFSLPIHK